MGTIYVSVPNFIKISQKHRHRTDRYLDALLANQPISDNEATDHCQKVTPQDGGLPELIVARSCLTNHSEAASLLLTRAVRHLAAQPFGSDRWLHRPFVVGWLVRYLDIYLFYVYGSRRVDRAGLGPTWA